jgi:hypothetical protein
VKTATLGEIAIDDTLPEVKNRAQHEMCLPVARIAATHNITEAEQSSLGLHHEPLFSVNARVTPVMFDLIGRSC